MGGDAALLEAYAIAIDASGNVWITNFGSNILTEFVGLASPVRTPLITLPVTP
jgi:streptogramin lyase